MKTLPLEKRKNGYDYTQLRRGAKACIYEQRFNRELISFEVFLIKTAPEKKIHGRTIESRERFPHDEAFGYWAFTLSTWDRALAKFNELENQRNHD